MPGNFQLEIHVIYHSTKDKSNNPTQSRIVDHCLDSWNEDVRYELIKSMSSIAHVEKLKLTGFSTLYLGRQKMHHPASLHQRYGQQSDYRHSRHYQKKSTISYSHSTPKIFNREMW